MDRKRGEIMAFRKHKIARPIHSRHQRGGTTQGFYTPFKDLDQQFQAISRKPAATSHAHDDDNTLSILNQPEDPDMLFHAAMADVDPLCGDGRVRIPPPTRVKNPPRFMEQENTEVHRHLASLVEGEIPFDLWYSDEYLDGAIVGLSSEIVKKLKKGDFSYQDYIDLHGYKREEAREKVNHFVTRSFARKLRCILIVSGRGLNSLEGKPVLKQELVRWLTRTPLRRIVLAFASARSYDGGAGAFYVLLRRNEGKARFMIPAR
jgi:DNA-nicking Smr family endonuclease